RLRAARGTAAVPRRHDDRPAVRPGPRAAAGDRRPAPRLPARDRRGADADAGEGSGAPLARHRIRGVGTGRCAARPRRPAPQAARQAETAGRQPEARPPAADQRAAIEEAAGPLVRALESRNLARLRQVYGTLTVEQAQEWGAFFMSARNPRVTLHVTSLDPRG